MMLVAVEGAKAGREVGLIPHDEDFALFCGLESQQSYLVRFADWIASQNAGKNTKRGR